MAKIDVINNFEVLNVTASVGRNGVNFKDDVMVVQALLKCALEHNPLFKNINLPEPNGTSVELTTALIEKFQRSLKNARRGVRAVADGRIDPAKGERPPGSRRRWTIIQLNVAALEARLLSGGMAGDFIPGIRQRWSQIDRILNDGVGSLGLSLEPSERPVGSLGLFLE